MKTDVLSYFDHLGYLFTGALGVAGLRVIAGWPPGPRPASVVEVALWTIAAYAGGHIVAFGGSLFLERFLVAHLLGFPSQHLLNEHSPGPRWWRPSYFARLSPVLLADLHAAQNRLFGPSFANLPASEQFLLQHHYLYRHDPISAQRLLVFLSQYDFMRNTSTVGLLLAVVALARHEWAVAGLFLVGATIFCLRYLKFLKLFAIELHFAICLQGRV